MQLTPLVSRLSILTKRLEVVRFPINWAQAEYIAEADRQFNSRGRVRIIVLKARQLGISTVTEACLYSLGFVFPDYNSLILAHERPAAQNLLKMTTRYWKYDPYRFMYTTKYAGKNHLAWNETGSSIEVSTAGTREVGRSATIHALHASEVGFYPDAEVVMLGLNQTIPDTAGTFMTLESTANGMGNFFHATWEAAVSGDVEYAPLFFPYHRHPEYLASYIGISSSLSGRVTDEEMVLRGMGLSDDRLAWRRWMIANKCNGDVLQFMQEYPATPEEAFVASGKNIFPLAELTSVYHPEPGYQGELLESASGIEFKPRKNGPLTIFRMPSDDTDHGQYLVAGDPARTRASNADYACVQVINRRTLEQVAEWRGRCEPVHLADIIFQLGIFYNTAVVTTEVTGPGYSTIGALLAKNYPRIYRKASPTHTPGHISAEIHGWDTSTQNKHLGMGWLINAVVEGAREVIVRDARGFDIVTRQGFVIHSATLFSEMKNYVTKDNGQYGPSSDRGFDDTVMAMMIAVVCNQMEGPIMPYGGRDGDEMERYGGDVVSMDQIVNAAEYGMKPWEMGDDGMSG